MAEANIIMLNDKLRATTTSGDVSAGQVAAAEIEGLRLDVATYKKQCDDLEGTVKIREAKILSLELDSSRYRMERDANIKPVEKLKASHHSNLVMRSRNENRHKEELAKATQEVVEVKEELERKSREVLHVTRDFHDAQEKLEDQAGM